MSGQELSVYKGDLFYLRDVLQRAAIELSPNQYSESVDDVLKSIEWIDSLIDDEEYEEDEYESSEFPPSELRF